MTVNLRHAFVSPKASDGDATRVQGPDWNAAHTLQQGPAALLGRSDATAGQAATAEVQLDPATMAFVGGKLSATGIAAGGFRAVPDGTEAAPGMAFASAPDTGLFKSVNGSYGAALSVSVRGIEQAEFIRRPAPYENSWLLLGSGAPVTTEGGDTYIATIGVQSFDWSGTTSCPVPINIGTVSATITDTITKTSLACMGELDKLDIYQSGGPVTVNRASGWRVRSPIPHAGVTLASSSCLTFTDPSNAIGGTVANHNCILVPPIAPGANGPATHSGIRFQGNHNAGSISSDASIGLSLIAGQGSGSGDVTIKGASTVLDTRVGSGGNVTVKRDGLTVAQFTAGNATVNFEFGMSGTNPLIRPVGSLGTAGLQLSSQGTGSIQFFTASGATEQVRVVHTASAVNRIHLTGGTAGNPPAIASTGADTDVDLRLQTQGAGGVVRFGTLTATADAPVTGYITIKDSTGTLRKLAVIA